MKKNNIEQIAVSYLSRFKGEPDKVRLVVNMLADKLTDIDSLRNFIIQQEFISFTAQAKTDKEVIIENLSETYGLSKSEIKKIIGK